MAVKLDVIAVSAPADAALLAMSAAFDQQIDNMIKLRTRHSRHLPGAFSRLEPPNHVNDARTLGEDLARGQAARVLPESLLDRRRSATGQRLDLLAFQRKTGGAPAKLLLPLAELIGIAAEIGNDRPDQVSEPTVPGIVARRDDVQAFAVRDRALCRAATGRAASGLGSGCGASTAAYRPVRRGPRSAR